MFFVDNKTINNTRDKYIYENNYLNNLIALTKIH